MVGAGLTGIEVACELPNSLGGLFGPHRVTPRVVLVEHGAIGSDMGASARPVIRQALSDNGIETRVGGERHCGRGARRVAVVG